PRAGGAPAARWSRAGLLPARTPADRRDEQTHARFAQGVHGGALQARLALIRSAPRGRLTCSTWSLDRSRAELPSGGAGAHAGRWLDGDPGDASIGAHPHPRAELRSPHRASPHRTSPRAWSRTVRRNRVSRSPGRRCRHDGLPTLPRLTWPMLDAYV